MALFKVAEIDDSERGVITCVGIASVVIGLVGGFVLFRQLDGSATVQSGYWSTLLTLSALSALPLVAMTTYVCRLWFGTGTAAWKLVSPQLVLIAVGVSLVGIVLCVYQVSVTSGSGNPNDWVLGFATLPAGAALGAAVFGVAAAVVDKIDPKPKEQAEPCTCKYPDPPPAV